MMPAILIIAALVILWACIYCVRQKRELDERMRLTREVNALRRKP